MFVGPLMKNPWMEWGKIWQDGHFTRWDRWASKGLRLVVLQTVQKEKRQDPLVGGWAYRWTIWKSIGMMIFPIYGKIMNNKSHVPNHQPARHKNPTENCVKTASGIMEHLQTENCKSQRLWELAHDVFGSLELTPAPTIRQSGIQMMLCAHGDR